MYLTQKIASSSIRRPSLMSSLNIQRVAQFQAYGEPVKIITDYPVPDSATLSPNECLVKMEYAGVCHSDVHARDGDMSLKPTLPRIGGHEGVGTIIAIGAGTVDSPVKLGDRVGLKFFARTCLKCELCRNGSGAGKSNFSVSLFSCNVRC